MEKTTDVEKFVKAVINNKNVKASNFLEKIIKDKCFKKIKNTLNS